MSRSEVLLGDGVFDLILMSHGSDNQGIDLGLEPEDGIHRAGDPEQFATFELARMNGLIGEDLEEELLDILERVVSENRAQLHLIESSIDSVGKQKHRRRCRKVRGKIVVRATAEVNEIL